MRAGILKTRTGILAAGILKAVAIGAAATAASVSAWAYAAPVELKQVSADAKWLAHLDVDAVRGSTVVQKAWQKGLEKHKDAESKLGFARAMLGMDITKDVHGITFYGPQIGKPPAVTIVNAAMDPDRISNLTMAISGRETTKYGDYEIHSWTKKRHKHTHTIAAAFRGKEQLLLATSVDDLKAALDVLDGKASSLSADSKLAGNVPDGTTFLLRVQGIAPGDLHCKSPVAKQIEAIRLVTGESQGQSFFRARLTLANPEVAALGRTAILGWQAQGQLLCPDELGRKLVGAVRPQADGSSLTVLWSASADDVWQAAQEIEKAVAKHIARKMKHQGKHGCPLCDMGCADGKCPLCDGKHGDGDKPGDGEKKAEKKKAASEEDF